MWQPSGGGALPVWCRSPRGPLALPSEIFTHVLADYRYRAFTRLPGSRPVSLAAEGTRLNQLADRPARNPATFPTEPGGP